MKIHFVGLSCFLIENQHGFRILVDPFNDVPEWSLGPVFPKNFQNKSFGANIVLSTEPDADHAYAPGDWLEHAPTTKPNSNPFPGLDLKGTVVYEHNGDVNVAWHYTVDGLRLAHFGDNAHLLTPEQIVEIGSPDIIFISPPKTEPTNEDALNVVRKNIEFLKPKVVIWAHHIAPKNLPTATDSETLRSFFINYFKTNASTNKGYEGEGDLISFCHIFECAILLNKEYSGVDLNQPMLEITSESIAELPQEPTSYLFRAMLADSVMD